MYCLTLSTVFVVLVGHIAVSKVVRKRGDLGFLDDYTSEQAEFDSVEEFHRGSCYDDLKECQRHLTMFKGAERMSDVLEIIRKSPVRTTCSVVHKYYSCNLDKLESAECKSHAHLSGAIRTQRKANEIIDIVCGQKIAQLERNIRCYTSEELNDKFDSCMASNMRYNDCDRESFQTCVSKAVHNNKECSGDAEPLMNDISGKIFDLYPSCSALVLSKKFLTIF